MWVLGLESSCDETAAALVSPDGVVLSDVVASQIAEHAPYGGVVPELAARAHLRAVVPVVEEALRALPGGLNDVGGLAVTVGPGLAGALLVGVQVAKALAWKTGLPLVGVNHLDGHLLAVQLHREDEAFEPVPYPYVALLASGGHTALYRVDAPHEIELLGQTRDDAAGEAFDKAAKVLGLGYPGGPVVDRLAAQGNPRAHPFPTPMPSRATLDFSFSGLKTALVRHVEEHGLPKDDAALADVCASYQRSLVEVLAKKSIAACTNEEVPRLVLAGGVAANRGLRARCAELAAKAGVTLHVPPLRACTDNAAMIAYAGALRLARGERDETLVPFSRDPRRLRGKFRRDGTLVKRRS
ncbi:MAG: tRNA (adenosine(37)-N6)-threonylcarbamoyltransferase complex transferase subunit TsaD [Sandaracinus sp.]|nr:tRNA (adenosine(37)-N6)-threonylcarbamoyltransferase complex transferase subunit TsaD [Myxococcales bacterium]MCB9600195.1 tRNA (adenosine(37)-N6)-threonylcarbamoyltransferase complex transferase subunit TsaD [Sandaracinus sp.]MCB9630837.1 tRNA (adenosine(37)-N6)-threonylcarbamoyltransferase complex transferase subunit TsaD [Sandaracinus sp.]